MRGIVRILLLVLAALLLIGTLAACNNGKEPSTPTPPSPPSPPPAPNPMLEGFSEAKELPGVFVYVYCKTGGNSYYESYVRLYYNEARQRAYLAEEDLYMLQRPGQAFVGISADSDGQVMLFDENRDLALSEGSEREYWMGKMQTAVDSAKQRMTLYLVFTDAEWTIRFDTLGGTGMKSQITVPYGSDLTASIPSPTKQGATFLGWKNAKGEMVTDRYGIPLEGYKTLLAKTFERTVLLEASNSFERNLEAVVLTAVYQAEKIPVTIIDEGGGQTVLEFDAGTVVTERDLGDRRIHGYSLSPVSQASFGAFTLTAPTTVYKFTIRKHVTIHVGSLRTEILSLTKSTSSSSYTYLKVELSDSDGYTFGGWYSDPEYQNPVDPYVQYATVLSDYYLKLIPVVS
ncbi:MAG: InlB B-repeat-containing protein [Clostridia bacterium]|nr:InlB B-repeat-containing protein [Clostridia bacterium]